jgi:hypothetical protein
MRLESYPWMDNARKGIRGDILQTMKCMACNETSVTFAMHLWNRPIQDGRVKMPCPHCGAQECSTPNTTVGYTREELAALYNAIDIYVQCSICEGDGMPIQEAKACGTPTLVVNYTAMAEKGRFPGEYAHLAEAGISSKDYTCHKGGEIIKVARYYYEPETSCKRALPDIEDMADKLRLWVNDTELRNKMGIEARKCVEENYDWNELWKQWEFVIDNVKVLDRTQSWESPISLAENVVAKTIPDGLTDERFVEWLYTDILKYPAIDPQGAQMWLQHISAGITREQLLNQFILIGNQQSDASKRRQEIRSIMSGQSAAIQKASPVVKQEWL